MTYYLSVLDEEAMPMFPPQPFDTLEAAKEDARARFIRPGEQPKWTVRGNPHRPDVVEMMTPSFRVLIESEAHLSEAGDVARVRGE